jgi:guanosine-3',5'-bis(diphosphate) 3'-pyrophosphohydrolase
MNGGSQGTEIGTPSFVFDSELLQEAYVLARCAHDDQRRRDGGPYVGHPVGVALRLHEEGYGEQVVAAALLHDVVEDAELEIGDVVRRFGVGVGELVAALTEDPSIEDWEARKRALRRQVAAAGPDAVAIYVGDKLSNVHELCRAYDRVGAAASESYEVPLEVRIRAWWEDAEMAAEAVPGLGSVGELRSELTRLEQQRATAGAQSQG